MTRAFRAPLTFWTYGLSTAEKKWTVLNPEAHFRDADNREMITS
jgi:hypothetical protein